MRRQWDLALVGMLGRTAKFSFPSTSSRHLALEVAFKPYKNHTPIAPGAAQVVSPFSAQDILPPLGQLVAKEVAYIFLQAGVPISPGHTPIAYSETVGKWLARGPHTFLIKWWR